MGILWGEIRVVLGETAWVLKPVLACLAHLPAASFGANYLKSPRLSYHSLKMEMVITLPKSVRMRDLGIREYMHNA